MKLNVTTTALLWICNISLVVLLIAVVVSGYYAFNRPGLPHEEMSLDGVTDYRYTQQLNLAGRQYLYQSKLNTETGQRSESYYYVPENSNYFISPDKAPVVSAQKLNPELSETNWWGMRTLSVFTNPEEVPLLNVTPGIEINREEFIWHVRMDFLGLMVTAGYLFILVWVLRKFVSGLRSGVFFSKKNALNLRITGWLVVVAPILQIIWVKLTDPSLNIIYSIEGASRGSFQGASFGIEVLIAGLILLVIARAFDEGVRLQKEQQLTI